MKKVTYTPIGIIHSPFKHPEGTPIQTEGGRDIKGTVEIFPEYHDGLKDLDGFSHIILIYHFHLSREHILTPKPYLDDKPRGVFSTRAPSRPNPIGMSIVRLDKVEDGTLYIRDLDIIDGAPLLDIKPFFPSLDPQEAVKIGWLEKKRKKFKKEKDDGRFSK